MEVQLLPLAFGVLMRQSRVVFHYNKAHNQDARVPPWVVKSEGQTHYVHHFTSEIGFSTKETPENEATRAALMVRGGVLELHRVGEELHARIVPERERVEEQPLPPGVRVLDGSGRWWGVEEWLKAGKP